MGKSYSYSIVVEQAGTLFMNNVEVPLPEEVIANGENPLGWALEQVRTVYASKFAEDESSELNLSVRDRRPGGLVRRARFRHPDSGIDLDTFLKRREPLRSEQSESPAFEPSHEPQPELFGTGQEANSSKGSPEGQSATSAQLTQQMAEKSHNEDRGRKGIGESHSGGAFGDYGSDSDSDDPQGPDKVHTATADEWAEDVSDDIAAREVEQARGVEVDAPLKETSPALVETSYEDKVRQERGWKKLPRDKSNRPQVGSAENEGRSRKLGLLSEAKKQRTRNIIAIIVIVVIVIVGFRIFNGGTDYEALCVDQRTMTRTVTGVACESGTDTNHRWWFTAGTENVPGPGDSIDTQKGTFDEPSGAKDTINYHVESDEDAE